MLAAKVTFFFEALGTGWTETHYNRSVGSIPSLIPLADDLALARAALLGGKAKLKFQRLSLYADRTDALIVGPLSYKSGFGIPPTIDFVFSARLLRCDGGTNPDFYHKEIYFAGNPKESSFAKNIAYRSYWKTAFKTFRQLLIDRQWGWLGLSAEPDGCPAARIFSIQTHPATLTVHAPTHGLSVGDTAHITYTRGSGGTANGDFPVTHVWNSDLFSVKANKPGYVYRSAGWVRNLRYQIIPYADIHLGPMTSYQRGNPFLPVSWDVPGKPDFALSPCGQFVDLLRSCYSAPVRFSAFDEVQILRRWYFARASAKPAPYSMFASGVWRDKRIKFSPPGELDKPHTWDKGSNIGALAGVCNVGQPAFWTTGLTVEQIMLFAFDAPPCCQPFTPDRGVSLRSKAKQKFIPPPPVKIGTAVAGKAKQAYREAQIPRVGTAVGGTARQGYREAPIPRMGAAVGGTARQDYAEAQLVNLGIGLGYTLDVQDGSTGSTDCCDNPPFFLCATITNQSGAECANGGKVLMRYSPETKDWRGTGMLGTCGHPISLRLYCAPRLFDPFPSNCNGYYFDVTWPDGCGQSEIALNPFRTPCSCDPFMLYGNAAVQPPCRTGPIAGGIFILFQAVGPDGC